MPGRLSSFDDYILLANSSKTSQMVKAVRGFCSVSPLHTIDKCCLYYLSQSLSLCYKHNQVFP